jgi:hypothetical protein
MAFIGWNMLLRNIIDDRIIEVPDYWKIHKNWEKIEPESIEDYFARSIDEADDADIIAYGYDGDCF